MRTGVTCVLALGLLPSLSAAAAGFDVRAIALDGAPLPGGGTFSQGMSLTDVSVEGEALVTGHVWDGVDLRHKGFLLRGDASDRVVFSEGEPAPGGGVFTDFAPRINGLGHYAFGGVIDFQSVGLYRRGSGAATVLAEPGDPAPSPQATHGAPLEVVGLNDAGEALFLSTLATPGGDRTAWILDDAGVETLVAIEGGPTPLGGTFDRLPAFGAALGADGAVVFHADVAGGSAGSGLFRWTGAGTAVLYSAGDPVPTTGGGTFERFYSGVDVNRAGAIGFVAGVDRVGLPVPGGLGLFVLDRGTLTQVVLAFDQDPGSGTSFGGVWDFDLDDAGRAAFTAPLVEEPWSGLFLFDGAGIHEVAYEGLPVPSLGAAFYQFHRVRLATNGPLLVEAGVDGVGYGVFAASSATIPALPGPGAWLALAILLLAFGTRQLLADTR